MAVAVASASSCSSDSTPSLETSIYCRCGPKKKVIAKKGLKGVPVVAQWKQLDYKPLSCRFDPGPCSVG